MEHNHQHTTMISSLNRAFVIGIAINLLYVVIEFGAGLYYDWLDLVMSLVIVLVIFYSTWNLFKDSLFLTLDGVPKGINFNEVVSEIKEVEGVIDVHHLHIWAMSTTQNAMIAHVLISPDSDLEEQNRIKNKIKHELEHVNIQHATLEFETEDEKYSDTNTI